MKYDLMHLPGVTPAGCGETVVETRLDDGHERGDRVEIKCKNCGRYGVHEVRARLTGIAEEYAEE